MIDAILINTLAMILGIVLIFFVKILVYKLIGDVFNIEFWFTPTFIYLLVFVFLADIFGAGLYPAFIISSILALPATYFAMDKWLSSYAFKITPPTWVYLLPVFIILLISISTISRVLFKAIKTNLKQ